MNYWKNAVRAFELSINFNPLRWELYYGYHRYPNGGRSLSVYAGPLVLYVITPKAVEAAADELVALFSTPVRSIPVQISTDHTVMTDLH